MGVTEFGPMVVKSGVDPMDETTEAGNIVATVYQNIIKEKTGPYRLYYGMEVEDPKNFWGFFDFDSVEDHKKFGKEYAFLLDIFNFLRGPDNKITNI